MLDPPDTYQLALQVAVTFLARLKKSEHSQEPDFRMLVREWMGPGSEAEVEWLCSSVLSVMEHHMEVQSRRRFLRVPLILAEPSYVASLRQGAAFRSLRRLGILSRLNRVVEQGLDSILSGKFPPSSYDVVVALRTTFNVRHLCLLHPD